MKALNSNIHFGLEYGTNKRSTYVGAMTEAVFGGGTGICTGSGPVDWFSDESKSVAPLIPTNRTETDAGADTAADIRSENVPT